MLKWEKNGNGVISEGKKGVYYISRQEHNGNFYLYLNDNDTTIGFDSLKAAKNYANLLEC